ncbi:MAG: hypothetical protein LQ349_007285 [Xanthoria aureola]|nr:MAG: hypothetical protein LQ349_007285 [Xanthoria aureola]
MASRVSEYEELLQDLGDRVCGVDKARIQRVLNKDHQDLYSSHADSSTAASSKQENMVDGVGVQDPGTERPVPGRKGSTESLDCVEEDLNRTAASRATGFMGKNSEVNWLGQVRKRTDPSDDDQDESDDSKMDFGSGLGGLPRSATIQRRGDSHPMSESTYHCDDIPLNVQDDVITYQVPPKEVADHLLSCYLECVHPAFPILGQTTFVKQYQAFYNNPMLQTGPLWLAILNILFAIAARYGRLAQAEWVARADDEHTYFSRARLLGLGSDVLWMHGELQRIQVTGLASFYLMAANQINRASAMSGVAIRQALTLGLNLRNEDRSLADSSKEIRYRVWWAIAVTERTLSVMTGRPAAFAATDCSAPLPVPLDEASFMSSIEGYKTPAVNRLRRVSTSESRSTASSTPSSISSRHKSPSDPSTLRSPGGPTEATDVAPNIGLFFLYVARLSNINDYVMQQLYRPPVLDQSWASVQSIMSQCQGRVERWRSTLPPIFDFTVRQQDREYFRARMCLGFSYYSTLTITFRPCLCKMERKMPHETGRARDIDHANAVTCILAVRSMLDLLPEQPDPAGMYQETPWWNMVHHLMQAVGILMLELSLGSPHCPNSAGELLHAAQKSVRWLRSMSSEDMAAGRAWRLSSELLQKVAPKVGARIDDQLLWPGSSNQAVPMDVFMSQPTTQAPYASDGYLSPPAISQDYAGYPPVTTWEPLMFTSYDNYLFADDQAAQNPQDQRWSDGTVDGI